jgi:ABC-type antimicrobial peptide transport system permease subunit
VENVRQSALDEPATSDVYIPLRQGHPDGTGFLRNNQFWVMRTEAAAASYRGLFVQRLREIDPDAAVAATGTMRQLLDAWLAPRRFNLGLIGAFTLTAVLLAVFGLYALVSYTVSQRRREIGLRMAMGATQRHIRRMILGQAVGVGVIGAAIGLALSATSRRLLASVVGDAGPAAGWAVATVCGLMAVVVVAAWLPARRAARIPPSLALQAD